MFSDRFGVNVSFRKALNLFDFTCYVCKCLVFSGFTNGFSSQKKKKRN